MRVEAPRVRKMNDHSPHVGDREMLRVRRNLEKLEHREWWRWATALVVILVLTIGLFILAADLTGQDLWEQAHIRIALRGLLGIVLIFGIFVVHQRVQVSRLRRQMAMQVATVATLEALKPLAPDERRGQQERRRWPRYQVDELLKVIAQTAGKEKYIYGRVRDISENGLGAVIPDALNPGSTVMLAFGLGKNSSFAVTANIRHRRGFHYGFEFIDVPAATLASLNNALVNIAHDANSHQPWPK